MIYEPFDIYPASLNVNIPLPRVICRYYGITSDWVDWTSMIFMVLYIPLIFPASWFLDKMVISCFTLITVNYSCTHSGPPSMAN